MSVLRAVSFNVKASSSERFLGSVSRVVTRKNCSQKMSKLELHFLWTTTSKLAFDVKKNRHETAPVASVTGLTIQSRKDQIIVRFSFWRLIDRTSHRKMKNNRWVEMSKTGSPTNHWTHSLQPLFTYYWRRSRWEGQEDKTAINVAVWRIGLIVAKVNHRSQHLRWVKEFESDRKEIICLVI